MQYKISQDWSFTTLNFAEEINFEQIVTTVTSSLVFLAPYTFINERNLFNFFFKQITRPHRLICLFLKYIDLDQQLNIGKQALTIEVDCYNFGESIFYSFSHIICHTFHVGLVIRNGNSYCDLIKFEMLGNIRHKCLFLAIFRNISVKTWHWQ